jgi:hypothetical protein
MPMAGKGKGKGKGKKGKGKKGKGKGKDTMQNMMEDLVSLFPDMHIEMHGMVDGELDFAEYHPPQAHLEQDYEETGMMMAQAPACHRCHRGSDLDEMIWVTVWARMEFMCLRCAGEMIRYNSYMQQRSVSFIVNNLGEDRAHRFQVVGNRHTVLDVKRAMLMSGETMSVSDMALMFDGVPMQDNQTLDAYDLSMGRVLLVPRTQAVLERDYEEVGMCSDRIPDLDVFFKSEPGQGSTTDPDSSKKDTEETSTEEPPVVKEEKGLLLL